MFCIVVQGVGFANLLLTLVLEEEMEKIALLGQDQSRGSATTDTSLWLCPSASTHLPSRQPAISILHYED